MDDKQKAPLLLGGKEADIRGIMQDKDSEKKQQKQLILGEIIRIADKYFEVILDAENKLNLLYRDKQELKADNVAMQSVRKFKGFTNHPDFLNYKADINGFINLSMPLTHEIKEGDFSTISALIKHVAQDKYEILLDYYTLLFRKPKQLLPIVVMVSTEQGTGKSTLLYLNEVLFENNAVTLGVSEYIQQFNGLYAAKTVIGIDESFIRDEFVKEKIKKDSTQSYIMLRKMHTEHTRLPFYGKFFLATNKELDFAKIDSEDIRFLVLKVPKIVNFDADFLIKLKAEAPYFLNHLLNRKLSTPKPLSRMWFCREQLETDALNRVRANSISDCAKDIQEFVADKISNEFNKTLTVTATDLYELIGRKYTINAISHALREELGYKNKNMRYRAPDGEVKNGRAFCFGFSPESIDTERDPFV